MLKTTRKDPTPPDQASDTKPAALNGAELIAAERKRQVEAEGWSASHDDGHIHGELPIIAAELAVHGTDASVNDPDGPDCWGLVKKHEGDRIKQLTIAGALIAAEIDRELRATPDQASEGPTIPEPYPSAGTWDDFKKRVRDLRNAPKPKPAEPATVTVEDLLDAIYVTAAELKWNWDIRGALYQVTAKARANAAARKGKP